MYKNKTYSKTHSTTSKHGKTTSFLWCKGEKKIRKTTVFLLGEGVLSLGKKNTKIFYIIHLILISSNATLVRIHWKEIPISSMEYFSCMSSRHQKLFCLTIHQGSLKESSQHSGSRMETRQTQLGLIQVNHYKVICCMQGYVNPLYYEHLGKLQLANFWFNPDYTVSRTQQS